MSLFEHQPAPYEDTIATIVRSVIDEAVREQTRRTEEILEQSLTDPEGRGVEIVWDWREDYTCEITYQLSADVPWGTIHEYPHGKDA